MAVVALGAATVVGQIEAPSRHTRLALLFPGARGSPPDSSACRFLVLDGQPSVAIVDIAPGGHDVVRRFLDFRASVQDVAWCGPRRWLVAVDEAEGGAVVLVTWETSSREFSIGGRVHVGRSATSIRHNAKEVATYVLDGRSRSVSRLETDWNAGRSQVTGSVAVPGSDHPGQLALSDRPAVAAGCHLEEVARGRVTTAWSIKVVDGALTLEATDHWSRFHGPDTSWQVLEPSAVDVRSVGVVGRVAGPIEFCRQDDGRLIGRAQYAVAGEPQRFDLRQMGASAGRAYVVSGPGLEESRAFVAWLQRGVAMRSDGIDLGRSQPLYRQVPFAGSESFPVGVDLTLSPGLVRSAQIYLGVALGTDESELVAARDDKALLRFTRTVMLERSEEAQQSLVASVAIEDDEAAVGSILWFQFVGISAVWDEVALSDIGGVDVVKCTTKLHRGEVERPWRGSVRIGPRDGRDPQALQLEARVRTILRW